MTNKLWNFIENCHFWSILWEIEKLKNVNFSKNVVDATKKSDLIIIHTEWNEFKQLNLKKITKNRNVIVYDMRNIYSPEKMKRNGIKYYGIGR